MDEAGNSSKKAEINVFLIDDHPLIREVMGKLVRKTAGLHLCGEATSADEALEKLPLCQPKPDVALVDLSLGQGQMNGISLIQRLRQQMPNLRILVISSQEESRFAPLALDAGAHGYLMKKDGIELGKAVHQVHNGRIYLSKSMRLWWDKNDGHTIRQWSE